MTQGNQSLVEYKEPCEDPYCNSSKTKNNRTIVPLPDRLAMTETAQLQVTAPNKSILNDKWDVVLSNLLVKGGLGFGVGVVTSVLLFKRRAFPVWLGIGFGLGRGYAEGDAIFRSAAGLRTSNA